MISKYNFQNNIISTVTEYIQNKHDKNHLLVLPTGSGKSVIAAIIAKKFKRILYVAHRLELIQQFQNYHMLFEDSFLLCCDISVVYKYFDQFFDLIIIDEAHRSAAKSYVTMMKNFSDTPILGLTATPIRNDMKKLTDHYQFIHKGPTTPFLQDIGVICHYDEHSVSQNLLPDLSDISLENNDYNNEYLSEKYRQIFLYGNIIEEFKEKSINRKTLIFCVDIKHCIELTEYFYKNGVRNVVYVTNATPKKERAEIYNDYVNDKIQVLINCMIYTEGIDIPSVSSIIMARPTLSQILFLQQGGRGGRPFKNKKDCLILDHANNIATHSSLNNGRNWIIGEDDSKGGHHDPITSDEYIDRIITTFEYLKLESNKKSRKNIELFM